MLVVDGKKICSRCKENLPVDKFHWNSDSVSGYSSSCKDCKSAPVGNQIAGRREKKDSVLWTKYGIRQEDYDKMYVEQEGRCAICNTQHDVLCVDHDHLTKNVRGLLCRECNFGLGKFGDDPNRLTAALAYLLASPT